MRPRGEMSGYGGKITDKGRDKYPTRKPGGSTWIPGI